MTIWNIAEQILILVNKILTMKSTHWICIYNDCILIYFQLVFVVNMEWSISFTWVQSTRRFEVQEKIMICESTSFTKHISSDLDVLTVIVLNASWTSIIHFGIVGCLFLRCLYIASDRRFRSLSVKCCSSPVWSSLRINLFSYVSNCHFLFSCIFTLK
jgi:hypothetical protein